MMFDSQTQIGIASKTPAKRRRAKEPARAERSMAIQQLEDELRHAQKMEVIGQLAASVVHDFNNLLTVILGYSEVLQHQSDVNERSRSYLTEIHKAGVQAETLTRQLLTFSRKQGIEMKDEDLNAVIMDIEGMLRRLIGEDILLTLKLDGNVGLVQVDPDQMKQVILNLVVNARDAMPRGGKLTIETSNFTLDQREHTMLTVSDTGVGMDTSLQERIFEPLFTTKSPDKGTGLGLSTVKRIVTQCRGRIEVDSEPGRGSSFKVYLPHVAQSRARLATLASPSGTWPCGKETVLVVEDDDRVRSLARQVLEICGYTVLEAGDGAEAMRRYERQAQGIDLLLSDVVMPHMGGRALADRMLELKPHLKVLFVSGYPNDAVMRQGVSESEAAFLQKPFTTVSLTQKVRQVLDGRN